MKPLSGRCTRWECDYRVRTTARDGETVSCGFCHAILSPSTMLHLLHKEIRRSRRVRQYSPAETRARRAVIEAARALRTSRLSYLDETRYIEAINSTVAELERVEREAKR